MHDTPLIGTKASAKRHPKVPDTLGTSQQMDRDQRQTNGDTYLNDHNDLIDGHFLSDHEADWQTVSPRRRSKAFSQNRIQPPRTPHNASATNMSLPGSITIRKNMQNISKLSLLTSSIPHRSQRKPVTGTKRPMLSPDRQIDPRLAPMPASPLQNNNSDVEMSDMQSSLGTPKTTNMAFPPTETIAIDLGTNKQHQG